jgi:hypothetical protein
MSNSNPNPNKVKTSKKKKNKASKIVKKEIPEEDRIYLKNVN